MTAKVDANAQPWRGAYDQMAAITDHTNSNAPPQTAGAGVSWAQAAELIRYAYGNWELVMMEATLGIASIADFAETMPNTRTYTESHRPQGTNNLFVAWQTLTHAQNPN